ncbi:YwqG family protein [Mycoplasma sp. P36-A1]|uniref:YwqG family protein n=1 Tax=Mycoplasma sp. P36-A1 TaxID=3252900 RepID=UPI003C2B0BE2
MDEDYLEILNIIKNQFDKNISEKICSTKLETIVLESSHSFNLKVKDSKIGGHGYLPRDYDYPSTDDGTPLHFLMQINLADLPKNSLLPNTGILGFYCGFEPNFEKEGTNIQCYTELLDENDPNSAYTLCVDNPDYYLGFSVNNPLSRKGYKVIYIEDISQPHYNIEDIKNLFEDDYIEESPIKGEVGLKFSIENRFLVSQGIDFEKEFKVKFSELNDVEKDNFDSILDYYLDSASTIGGYPINIKKDLRYNLPEKYHNYKLLLSLDSNFNEPDISKFSMMWGDMGIGKFYIDQSDLDNLDFSKTWFYWESN